MWTIALLSSTVSFLRMESGAFASLRHFISRRRPCLYPTTLPFAVRSFSTSQRHISLVRPLLRFPLVSTTLQIVSTRGRKLLSIRSTCPIHFHHLRLLTDSFHASSLVHLFILSSYRPIDFKSLRRHLVTICNQILSSYRPIDFKSLRRHLVTICNQILLSAIWNN